MQKSALVVNSALFYSLYLQYCLCLSSWFHWHMICTQMCPNIPPVKRMQFWIIKLSRHIRIISRRHFIRCMTTWWQATNHINKTIQLTQYSLAWTRLRFEPTQSWGITLHFGCAKRIPNISTLSFKRSRRNCNLLGSSLCSTTSSAEFLSKQILMPLFLHEDGGISITISMAKSKRKVKEDNPDKRHFSWRIQIKRRHRRELGFGRSHTKNGWAKWISLPYHSMRGSAKELHDRMSSTLLPKSWLYK